MQKYISITNTRNYVETQIGKNHGAAHKSTVIREIAWEKKRILTSALYNGTK